MNGHGRGLNVTSALPVNYASVKDEKRRCETSVGEVVPGTVKPEVHDHEPNKKKVIT